MTDQQPTPDLTAIARTDQAVTELNAVIGPIAAAYRMLTASGMPDDRAASIAETYGDLSLARHFGVQPIQYSTYINGEDD